MPKIPERIVEQMAKRPEYSEEILSAGIFLRNGLGLTTKTIKGLVAARKRKNFEDDEWSVLESILNIIMKNKYPDYGWFTVWATENVEGAYEITEPSDYDYPPEDQTLGVRFAFVKKGDWKVYIAHHRGCIDSGRTVFDFIPTHTDFSCHDGECENYRDINYYSLFSLDLRSWAKFMYRGAEEPVYKYVEGLLGT